jgi:hypothetical protein
VKTGEQCQEKNKRNRLFFLIFPDPKNTAYRFASAGKTPDEVVPGNTRRSTSCRISICGARWGENAGEDEKWGGKSKAATNHTNNQENKG